jgi:hypothetical protein
MTAPTGIKAQVKDLARGLVGFYETRAQTEAKHLDVRSGLQKLSDQILMLTSASETTAQDIVERILAFQQPMSDHAAAVRMSQEIALDQLAAIQSSLETLREEFRKLDPTSTEACSRARRQKIKDGLSHNGLFVVGHARTGTSILQTALNTSSEIFLLGEANLHISHDKPGFSSWYRTMHECFDNTPSKSTTCPDSDEPAGDGWDALLTLRQHYRLVGDKMAFRPRHLGYDFAGAFRFLQDHFTGAYIIGTLRHPRDVLGSNAKMFRPDDINKYAVSYLECLALEIDLVRTFDRATILVHENVVPDTFVSLGEWLGCDLRNAYAQCYEAHFSMPRHGVPDCLRRDLLDMAEHYYLRLRKLVETSPFGHLSTMEMARLRQDLRADIAREEERDRVTFSPTYSFRAGVRREVGSGG